nr:hypothetical protein CFP56_30935 [Quercus suber]
MGKGEGNFSQVKAQAIQLRQGSRAALGRTRVKTRDWTISFTPSPVCPSSRLFHVSSIVHVFRTKSSFRQILGLHQHGRSMKNAW